MSKPHSKPEDRDQLAAQVAQLRKRLELGKTSAALKDAKDLAKRFPGDATTSLLADCYAARIVDLQRGGQETEAKQLLAIARERFADAATRWDDLVDSGRRQTGDFGDVLAVLADEASTPEQRERAEATLRADLADPRLLCTAEQLPADHELRVAARAVSDAFVEAARGALTDAAREAMRAVARRSPLAPWRAFVLALDAFHRSDDDAMLEQLERIPDDAAPAPLAQALRDRLAGRPPKTPLAERLDGGASALLRDLAALQSAVHGGTATRAGALVVPIVRGLAAFEPRLASRFLRWLDMQTEKAVPTDAKFFATIRPLLPDGELERLHAGTFDEQDPAIGFLAWTDWLWPRARKSLRPLNDDEIAVLLDRLVTVADRAFARIAPVLVEHRVPSRGVLPLPEANQFGRSLYEVGDRGSDTESAADHLIALATVVQGLLTRVDAADVVVRGSPPGFAFAALACRVQPTPERYRTWQRQCGSDWTRREGVLREWQARFDSAEIPLAQAEIHLERREPKAALDAIAKARTLDPMHEGLRNDAPSMLAAVVRLAARAGDRDVAAAAARELAADSSSKHGPIGAYARTASTLLDDPQAPKVDPILAPLVAADLAKHRGEELVPIGATTRERVQCVVRWDSVAAAVDMDEDRIAQIRVEDLADCVEDDLPNPGEELLQLTRLAVLRGQMALAYRFAGHGMQSDTRLLPRFLANRARAVRSVHGDKAAAPLVQLLAAAVLLRQDPEAAADFGPTRLLSDVVDAQDGSHDENWFRAELARERTRGDDLSARRESEVTT